MIKVWCTKCHDFTYHDFRKMVWCSRCRERGDWRMVLILIAVPIALFLVSVYLMWRG